MCRVRVQASTVSRIAQSLWLRWYSCLNSALYKQRRHQVEVGMWHVEVLQHLSRFASYPKATRSDRSEMPTLQRRGHGSSFDLS